MYKRAEKPAMSSHGANGTEMAKIGRRGTNPSGALSTQEVAVVLGLSHPTLLKLLRERKIPEPPKVGNARQWNSTDVQQAQVLLRRLVDEGEVRLRGLKK
jgi:excisionase family DNA binding protein